MTKDDAPDRSDDMGKKATSTALRLALFFSILRSDTTPPFVRSTELHTLRYVNRGLESLPTVSPYPLGIADGAGHQGTYS